MSSRRGVVRWGLFIYLALLAASAIFRGVSDDPPPRPDQTQVFLPAMRAEGPPGHPSVRMAFTDSGGGAPVVVLLHGSPASSGSVMAIHRDLATRGYRVLTPDLPGFGRSEDDIPDYSIRAHARYVLALLDTLQVAQVDVIGYSMGGGVGLEMGDLRSDRVRSLVMLSSIGVQELELTGDYYLNHTIHALQLGALWLASEGLPHFGLLDHVMLGVPYARNFYESDQRPVRVMLARFQAPVLIIHGREDPLVPFAAAREHARLLPQSRFVTLESGHGLPFVRPDTVSAIIDGFLLEVSEGRAPTRLESPSHRLAAAARPFDPRTVPRPSGFATVILICLIALSTLVSEDLASIGAGLMAARGTLTFPEATLAALGGIVLGDLALYLAGRWIGHPLVRKAPFKWLISAQKLEVGERWFAERGIRAVLVARFIPGTRLPTYVAAGVLRAPFIKFFSYFLIAALIWTPAIVGASMLMGQSILTYYASFEQFAFWVVLGVAVLLLVLVRVLPGLFTHEGRRRLAGSWQRLTRWEFWPPWLFYPPVVLYAVWLSLRHRHPLAFTAANPSIPHGGLVGESKHAILTHLPPERVAEFTLIPPGPVDAAVQQATRFISQHDLSYPIVLKPDAGERGRGVAIVRSESDIRCYFQRHRGPTIVQRYVTGSEYGVFYYRDPDSGRGTVFSVTEKTFPMVTGDGVRTLYELILDDERAVAMHALYAAVRVKELDTVPLPGQSVQLVELGTHCRGAVFLDGSRLITPELTAAIDAIARSFPGFHFGRFDLRTPGPDSLKAGEALTVIELNGVTSEATHIYHPGSSLLRAWRTLFFQWNMAYRIGAANRKRGATVSRPLAVVRALAAHYYPAPNQQPSP